MADTTFRTVLPALKAVDNGDGTYSMGVTIRGVSTGGTGRAITYTIASDVGTSTLVQAQADEVLTGTSMETRINAVLVILNGYAGRPKLLLVGNFACDGALVPQSDVDVELQGTITITMTSATIGMNFLNIVNSIWSGGTINRAGTIAPAGLVNTMQFEGNDPTLIIQDMVVKCDIVEAVTEQCGAIRLIDGNPTFINVTAYGGDAATGPSTSGWNLLGVNNTPHLINCIAYGGGGNQSAGYFIAEACKAILDNCIGYGSVVSQSEQDGIIIWDTSAPTLNSCTGIGGAGTSYSYGILIGGGAPTPILNSCIGHGGIGTGGCSNVGIELEGNCAPIINNPTCTPQSSPQWFRYDDANNGRFRPFAGYNYQLSSMYVLVWAGDLTVTLDIGTSIGGHEIAQNIATTGLAFVYFPFTREYLVANSYMYVTPSAPVADDKFFVGYTVNYDSGYQDGLYLKTYGHAVINGGSFISGRNGYAVKIGTESVSTKNWVMNNPNIENINLGNPSYWANALQADAAITDAPIYNARIKGFLGSITSFAKGSQTRSDSGTWVVANGQDHVHVTHGLSWTPVAGDIAIGFTTLDNSTACYIDGYSSTEFIVHVNAAASAATTTGWWKAIR